MRLFTPPQKDPSEFLLYVWKIIDLDNISEKELLYHISFELFLMSPKKAHVLINKCLEKRLLKKNSNGSLSLSENLESKLSNWQKKRSQKIIDWEEQTTKQQTTLNKFKKSKRSDFNVLLKAFLDKGTLNRAVTVSDKSFNFLKWEKKAGLIQAEVQGSKKEPYSIKIDINKKILIHNCTDFVERRAEDRKFCKHLAKLFLLLKEKNKDFALDILNKLASSINEWEFSNE